jgi:hypothetical protein
MRSLFVWILLLVLTLGFSVYAAYPQITLKLADIHSPAFHAKNIKIQFVDQQTPQLEINIEEIGVQNNIWRHLNLSCDQFKLDGNHIQCTSGQLKLSDSVSLPIAFQFDSSKKYLQFNIQPTAGESWQFSAHWDEDNWRALLTITDGQAAHLAQWLPRGEEMPMPSHGKINANAKLDGDADGLTHVAVDLSVHALGFSDQAGLHAGEKIEFAFRANADYLPKNNEWHWDAALKWPQGEVFWQPVYFVGNGHDLHLNGVLSNESVRLHDGKLSLVGIGEFEFSGLIMRSDETLRDFELHANNTKLSALFEQMLKPFLRDTAFAELTLSGQSDLTWEYRDGANKAFILDLDDVSVVDERGRFAFNRINAHIPWRADGVTIADISILNGEALRIPFGAVRVPLELHNFNFLLPQLVLPLLDGELMLEDFVASYQVGRWYWGFSGELTPVSMENLTEALQIQSMHGTLSGHIPEVSYNGKEKLVSVGGELLFNIFDGKIVVNNLSLLEPMGFAPHLKADVEMRNLDLGLLTQTFSFGKIEGRIDMDMRQLELANWKPVRFDAHLQSSPGRYKRRISQAAIKNISSLGGDSAVAAIQRSFLRFFEEFSYSDIGWRCALRNNVCYMGGIEPEPQAQYTLVSGGGIPAITVMGYNHNVGWQELIDRLKRVTQEGEPTIQ